MGELYDAPNQQAVRADGSAPWDEGEGGSGVSEATVTSADGGEAAAGGEDDLDSLTKDQLLELAGQRGLDVNAAMSKGEIRTAIDQG